LGRLFAISLILLQGWAWAEESYDIDVQNFRPAMDSKGFISLDRSKALGTLEPSIGLYLNYAFKPLRQKIDGEQRELLESYGTGDFVLALGFFNLFEVGAALPIVIIRGDGDGPGREDQIAGDGFGDMRLNLKLRILDREAYPVGLALVPSLLLPTGEAGIFASHGKMSILPKLVIDWDLGSRVGMALNLGARLREKRSLERSVSFEDENGQLHTLAREDPIILGNELLFGFGLGVQVFKERLEFILESFGSSPLEGGAQRANPLEVLAAFRFFLSGNSYLSLGASHGLMAAYGDPDLRLFAGILFEPSTGDRDGDGLPDDIDSCPDDPEDKDLFEDQDGCPDLDNDKDGILDINDLCPNDPEDFNRFEDHDGCPDDTRDRDGDGVVDSKDLCPDEPEDQDNFQDEDGCPDLDNDGDGIPDRHDDCPDQAEDPDGFKDEDGCPELDNDGDGILDRRDRCPNKPENFNGIEDEDGCPEAPKKIVITGGKIRALEKIYFETSKAVIKSESYEILSQVAETLQANPQISKVEIQGHTDSRGKASYNLRLSERRAAAVRTHLIEQGVEGARLVARGYGEEEPIDPSENVQAYSKNRRVEFVILEEGGSP